MKTLPRLMILLALLVVALQLPASQAQAQGDLPIAYVLCDQYMRSQPDDTSTPLALLRAGEPTLLISGRSQDGYWLVAVRSNGQAGWVADTGCIEVQGNKWAAPWTAPAPYTGPQVATLSCEQYLYSAPRTGASRLVYITDPDTVGVMAVLGRDETETWLLIQSQDGSLMGWLYYGECVYLYGDTVNLPVSNVEMPAPVAPEAQVQATAGVPPTASIVCPQYVRSAPSTSAARLIVLQSGDELTVLGRDRAAAWLLIQRTTDGAMGWVADTNCVRVQGDVFAVPNRIDVVMPIPGQTTPTAIPTALVEGTPFPTATPIPTLTPTPSEPLPFPGAVGGQGVFVPGATPVPIPPDTLMIQLCGSTSTPVTVQSGGRPVRLYLPLTVVGRDEIESWYRDDDVFLWVNAVQVPVTSTSEIPPSVANLAANWWAGGYAIDLGPLTPGLHYVYLQMNLSRQHQTIDRVYPAGEYRYDCAVTIQ